MPSRKLERLHSSSPGFRFWEVLWGENEFPKTAVHPLGIQEVEFEFAVFLRQDLHFGPEALDFQLEALRWVRLQIFWRRLGP